MEHVTFANAGESASAPPGGDDTAHQPSLDDPSTPRVYLPIAATLRLYAGWLLAYYAVVYALGWYVRSRPLPFAIPYVEALLLSPLVLSFTLAAFLFLILQSAHNTWGKGPLKGCFLGVCGLALFLLYRTNVA
ncbi:hypothetical protein FJZ27_02160 [Candidatus Peribacteria bacterium]|nr:hypothetical protein [Candidatus Peribacteria bacterium]MBM3300481.1 hypothetical protein [Deltaproteobacteria bacterium]